LNIGGRGTARRDSGGGSSDVRHEVGRVAWRQTLGNGERTLSSADENASRGVIALARVGETLANRRNRREGHRSSRRINAVTVGGLAIGGDRALATGKLASIGEERNTAFLRCGESSGRRARGNGGGNSDESVRRARGDARSAI
jgi:hypothetical protein